MANTHTSLAYQEFLSSLVFIFIYFILFYFILFYCILFLFIYYIYFIIFIFLFVLTPPFLSFRVGASISPPTPVIWEGWKEIPNNMVNLECIIQILPVNLYIMRLP